MEQISKQFKLDFLLYIGDDPNNEPVFSFLNQKLKANNKKYTTRDAHVITCTIGRKPSNARYFMNEPQDVASLFESLVAIKPEKSDTKQRRLRPVTTRNDFDWFQSGALMLSDKDSEDGLSDKDKKMGVGNRPNRAMTTVINKKGKSGNILYREMDSDDDLLVTDKDFEGLKYFDK